MYTIPTGTIAEVIFNLEKWFSRTEGSTVRLIGLLFARPQTHLCNSEILPNLEYFHHRSAEHINFFCAGYSRNPDEEFNDWEPLTTSIEGIWYYSPTSFNRFREDVASQTKWQYSGEVDLILLNAERDKKDNFCSLKFESSIVCQLDQMIHDQAISSVSSFIEKIVSFTENFDGTDPAWGFSDSMGAETAGSALKRVILSLLPKDLGKEAAKAYHFAVRDIRPAT
ncbi:MAG: hypothetical protein JW806_04130 [Sedimentisphaerales bacterium]|nr:hypothetical protein [Sedimentisphaerales bacterium]